MHAKSPRRGSPATQAVSVELSFDSELHRSLHHILVKYGFIFMVGNGHVGRKYHHPEQHLLVDLLDDDDSIETAIRATDGTLDDAGHLIAENEYEPAEWQQIMAAGPDVANMMERELSILFQVRERRIG